MSHLESGFCVTDMIALAFAVKENCPDLELVKQATYRTWVTGRNSLVGDYPLPAMYQLKLLLLLKKQGVDVHVAASKQGVTLPKNLLELEKKPWTLEQQRKLLDDPVFQQAYNTLAATVIGKDAEYVIRYKEGKAPNAGAYEIGLVPNPIRTGEYLMMTDFYAGGKGLLLAKGLGAHCKIRGEDSWGGELKQAYAVKTAEREIVSQIGKGNPEFGSYTKTKLPDGRVKIEVHPRSN